MLATQDLCCYTVGIATCRPGFSSGCVINIHKLHHTFKFVIVYHAFKVKSMKIQVLVWDSPIIPSVIVLICVLQVGRLRYLGSVPHGSKQIFFPIQKHSDWLWGSSSLYLPGAEILSLAVKSPSCEADCLFTYSVMVKNKWS